MKGYSLRPKFGEAGYVRKPDTNVGAEFPIYPSPSAKKPWFNIEGVCATAPAEWQLFNSLNGVHIGYYVKSGGRTIKQCWNVRMILKGRDNGLTYG